MPEDGVECDCILIVSIDYLFTYEKKHYLQMYLVEHPENILIKSLEINKIAIITVKGIYYRCIIHDISKSDTFH